MELKESC